MQMSSKCAAFFCCNLALSNRSFQQPGPFHCENQGGNEQINASNSLTHCGAQGTARPSALLYREASESS